MFDQIQLRRLQVGSPKSSLIQGDISIDADLLESLYGKVQCVYVDPPFMTGQSFSQKCPIGESGWRKGKPFMNVVSYSDQFDSAEAYEHFLLSLTTLAKKLLKPDGVFYLHLDWRGSGIGRMVCDKVFGAEHFMNDIIWAYESGGRSTRTFSHKHDTIFMYSKTAKPHFDIRKVPISRTEKRKNHMKRSVDADGRVYRSIISGGKEYRYYDDEPSYPSDVWTDISHLQQRDPERTGYPTQKPKNLLKRLLAPVCEKGDIVVDLCAGSATTAAAACDLLCSSVSIDLLPSALNVSLPRLGNNFLLENDLAETEALLEAEYDASTGILTLFHFSADGLEEIPDEPLAHIQQYAAGFILDSTLCSQELHFRSASHPSIPAWCQLELADAPLAITIVDSLSRRYVFQYTNTTVE